MEGCIRMNINRVAVVGAGVMGSAIAAHFANVGFPVDLLDIAPSELSADEKAKGLTLSHSQVRNRIVRNGLESAKRSRPAAFFVPEFADLIRLGNLEDHLSRLSEVDWIIEAVTENFEIKEGVLRRIETVRKPGAIVSSNTSGIPIYRLSVGLSEDFRGHWLGTHFFNPPRYMKLLEVIPTAETLPAVIQAVAEIGDRRLGKGIVYAKDTPNFIANRIGTLSLQHTLQLMIESHFSIDEIDQMTGPAIGRPKSATFRTLDIVGIDTFVHVTNNIYQNAPYDERRELFKLPSFIDQMLQRKWLGEKSGQGFYKRAGKGEILSLDLTTMEYGPRRKGRFPSLETAKSIDNLGERLRFLVRANDPAGTFLWKTLSEVLVYSANRVPEISNDLVNVDNAMKWGFNWELGPFETWDTLGAEEVVARLQKEGRDVPALVERVLRTAEKSFYARREGVLTYFDLKSSDFKPVPEIPGVLFLASLKERQKVIKKNAATSLVDLGDGVACVEFHSKMNSIGGDTIQMIHEGLKVCQENFLGLVIGNQGRNFSVGANLMLILLEAQEENWEEIDAMVRTFQKANQAIKYSEKPVVVAPFGMCLGGGCEIALHANHLQSAAETYMGLVELGVGLIPAGGGTKEMLLRSLARCDSDADDLLPHLRQSFETVAMGKVSGSAMEARRLGFLRAGDGVTMSRDRLIQEAKDRVLSLARQGYQKPFRPSRITALGNKGLASLKVEIHLMLRAGFVSEYDAFLAGKLAYVFCGGDCNTTQMVTEQYLLDLEREVFLNLCGQSKTQERIQHMLQKGKPLRN
jgi:3-hydroxyacyl-CoA dehydrogenase